MAKFKIGDTIHKIGEKILRPLKIEGMDGDDDYIIEHKGFYLGVNYDPLYELVTDEIYVEYTKYWLSQRVLQCPLQRPKIELDEKKIRELLESSEMTSRFSIREFLEESIIKSHFEQDTNGDMMRKPLDDL